MKKLNLQLGSIKEMLTKEQMKKVAGGYDGGGGNNGCPPFFFLCTCVEFNYSVCCWDIQECSDVCLGHG